MHPKLYASASNILFIPCKEVKGHIKCYIPGIKRKIVILTKAKVRTSVKPAIATFRRRASVNLLMSN